eukprot:gnl/MRDRNA2_/MRDRNA2_74568_c0_seq3.p1 gnl/MRDRNA2_/MRDRNA2_74568_c0~~gnl/MRDRNA2_/MRDRNA2_74568_c0_seq3.p1  ORF type:complete len:329 (+),score=58.44 gnl/MRDRNA2_/MRDRNA2_74568_c0_seq3:2-988(+)
MYPWHSCYFKAGGTPEGLIHDNSDAHLIWREKIIGLQKNVCEEILEGLNTVRVSDNARACFGREACSREFDLRDAVWCVEKYGSSRAHALRTLEKWFMTQHHIFKHTGQSNNNKNMNMKAVENEQDGERSDLWYEVLRSLGVDPAPGPPKEKIHAAFEKFDIYGVGCLDVRLVDDFLVELGYDLRALEWRKLRAVINQYDRDSNTLLSKEEIHQLLQEEKLRALYRCSEAAHHGHVGFAAGINKARKINRFASKERRQDVGLLGTPLLADGQTSGSTVPHSEVDSSVAEGKTKSIREHYQSQSAPSDIKEKTDSSPTERSAGSSCTFQ